jgi:hypothetical protein
VGGTASVVCYPKVVATADRRSIVDRPLSALPEPFLFLSVGSCFGRGYGQLSGDLDIVVL